MKEHWFGVVFACIGIAIAALVLLMAGSPLRQTTRSVGAIALASVLWIHSPTFASSGTERWYNFTLTMNQTVPLKDLFFNLYLPHRAVADPPGFCLDVLTGGSVLASYNYSMGFWKFGAAGSLAGGESLSVSLPSQALIGDTLTAIPQGPFGGGSSVVIP